MLKDHSGGRELEGVTTDGGEGRITGPGACCQKTGRKKNGGKKKLVAIGNSTRHSEGKRREQTRT